LAVNENADKNEIPFTAENETKTKMDIHASFAFLQVVLVDGFHFPHVQCIDIIEAFF